VSRQPQGWPALERAGTALRFSRPAARRSFTRRRWLSGGRRRIPGGLVTPIIWLPSVASVASVAGTALRSRSPKGWFSPLGGAQASDACDGCDTCRASVASVARRLKASWTSFFLLSLQEQGGNGRDLQERGVGVAHSPDLLRQEWEAQCGDGALPVTPRLRPGPDWGRPCDGSGVRHARPRVAEPPRPPERPRRPCG